ncbi:MAG: uroporphyrinogen decarboxylase family protein [Desulfobacterales bacterium]
MTSRERVRATLRCERPDRIPKALGFFSQSIAAIAPTPPEEHFSLDVRFLEFDSPANQNGFLDYLEGLPPDLYLGNPSQLRTYHEWDYYPERGAERPMSRFKTLGELAAYVFPGLNDPSRHMDLRARTISWQAEGYAVAGSPPHLGGELFEMAMRLRGFSHFMADLVQRKEMAHFLLDQLTDMLIENVRILAQAGIDILLLDDDIAMPTGLIISPATWREFFKPRLRRAIRAAREISPETLIFYHSDGDFTRLIPDLLEIGVNVVNPVQPDCMDAAAVKRAFGDRLALWGTVGTALQWDRGTPAQIREEVRRRIAALGPEGLLLSPAYDIDFSPFANIEAFVEAVEAFGR